MDTIFSLPVAVARRLAAGTAPQADGAAPQAAGGSPMGRPAGHYRAAPRVGVVTGPGEGAGDDRDDAVLAADSAPAATEGGYGDAVSGVPTGFAALDARLAGDGWPRFALTELLLPSVGVELRLLAPALAAALGAGRPVMLFDPPASLSAYALAQVGLDAAQLLVIHGRSPVLADAGSLWALEQALASGHVGAVVAWLPPRLRAGRLRRLQQAARRHDGCAFVLCDASARDRPTAAPLRLAVQAAGADRLALRLLKHRGASPAGVLHLDLPPLFTPATDEAPGGHQGARAHTRVERAAASSASAAVVPPVASAAAVASAAFLAPTASATCPAPAVAGSGGLPRPPGMAPAPAPAALQGAWPPGGQQAGPAGAAAVASTPAATAALKAPPIVLLPDVRVATSVAEAGAGAGAGHEAEAEAGAAASGAWRPGRPPHPSWHAPLHAAVFVDLGA